MKYIPVVGKLFTISPNLSTGDRSYTNAVWKCIEVNDTHVIAVCEQAWLASLLDDKPKLFVRNEHNFGELNGRISKTYQV